MKLINKLLLLEMIFSLFLTVLLVTQVSAEIQTLGVFKMGANVSLIQTCSNCSFVNLTTIQYPDSSTEFIGRLMTKIGTDYNYTFTNTSQLGKYIVSTCGDVDTELTCVSYDFKITPSGSDSDSSQSLNLLGSLLIILLLGIVFFFIAHKSENKVAKISFYTFSVIIFIISVLYIVVIMQQTLFGFESILTGIETFWFVVKIGITIGILAFIIILFMIFLKAWKIKRGLYDE